MKIQRTDLIDLIKSKVFLTSNLDALEKIEQELTVDGKFNIIEFKNLKMDFNKLEMLNDAELYWIVGSATKYITAIKSVDSYFDDAEIENAKFYTREIVEKVQFPISFKNVENLEPNENRQFGFYLTVKQIAMLKNNGLLEVVPELQRDGKKDKYGELKVKVNKKRATDIKNAINEGRYFYDQIKLNLINDDASDFFYNPDEKTLTINSGTLIIPDGNHRTIACELADLGNINSENKYSIAFTFLTPMQTKELLAQTWNMEPISQRQKESMKITSSNLILEAVLRNPDADPIYVKNIVRGENRKGLQNGFILYDVLSKAIDKYYKTDKIETHEERIELAQWLIEFLNKLTSILIQDFKNYKEVYKTRWSVDPYTFIGYIILSANLQFDANWKNRLTILIKSIDFTNENSPIKNQLSKSKEKSVEIFFNEVIKNAETI